MLLLMPAAVLIVVVLGAIAIDLSVVHLGEREAVTVAGDAANDAVTRGLDQAAVRSGGGYRLDPGAVEQAVAMSVAASELGARVVDVQVTTTSAVTVEVTIALTVDYVFARGLPGAADGTTVAASATATVLQR